jgi:predicted nucleotidyltransferase
MDRTSERKPRPTRAGHRRELLALATEFIASAAVMPGVRRIAVLGSIVTPKEDPKDIDLLVEISDTLDLATLARLGRRLKGRAQSLGRGADVFLADAGGTYIGRTCLWRECRAGIRRSCDADHCGRRPHLHDDLSAVCLEPSLIKAPPLDVWPEVIVRIALPADVAEWLHGLPEPAA